MSIEIEEMDMDAITRDTTLAGNLGQAGEMADAYGALTAKIADLEKLQKQLRQGIIDLGLGAVEGKLFRVTVSVGERSTLDMAAVREHLSAQFITAHTKTTETTTVRCVARNGGGV